MKAKSIADSKTIMSQLMMPTDSNSKGYVHGGTILAIADKVAYVCATRHAGNYCVTASVDRVDFHEPIRIGELVTFMASVNFVGNTSLEIGIRVEAETLPECKKRHTNSIYMTMVALNKNNRPTKVPKLILKTKEEKIRFKEGEKRRKLRLERLKK